MKVLTRGLLFPAGPKCIPGIDWLVCAGCCPLPAQLAKQALRLCLLGGRQTQNPQGGTRTRWAQAALLPAPCFGKGHFLVSEELPSEVCGVL